MYIYVCVCMYMLVFICVVCVCMYVFTCRWQKAVCITGDVANGWSCKLQGNMRIVILHLSLTTQHIIRYIIYITQVGIKVAKSYKLSLLDLISDAFVIFKCKDDLHLFEV